MRVLPNIFVLIATALLASACGKPETGTDVINVSFAVTPASQQVLALGEQKTFSVTSSSDWYARSSASWAKLTTATGKGAEEASSLVVTCEENKTTTARSAEITVTNLDKESVVVSLEQAAGTGQVTTRGISTAEDLVGFAKAANGDGSIAQYVVNGVIKILNDIDASSITEWVPAGTEAAPLTYSIDGGNYTIKNVNWKVDVSKYPHAGFIGYAKGITIEKLNFGSEGSKVEFTGEADGKVRVGGILGYGVSTSISRSSNNADLTVSGSKATGNNLILGGVAGFMDSASLLGGDLKADGCINNGDVSASVVALVGGIVGYNSAVVKNCTNNGTVKALSDGNYGPGWLCSFNNTKGNVTSNYGYGYVGETPAMMKNSMINYEDGYDLENNVVDWTLDSYYDWEEVEKRQLHAGATYYHYSFKNVPRHMHVLEIDLSNSGIELTSSFADDIVPNPNRNGNANNGYNLRETLSKLCTRKRAEGQKILAGINCSFFDSNDGIPRGFHVENGEPVYINNPDVVSNLKNHVWGFTVFADGTASCGVKKFSGKMRAGGKEYSYYSINDTIMRHTSSKYMANLYTSRYVKTPHPTKPAIINDLASNAVYVICEYSAEPMKVNTGYAAAKVVSIHQAADSKPYITSDKQIGIALSGSMASEWLAFLKEGDTVEFQCTIAIDGDSSMPILTMDSTMYQLLTDGEDASNTPGSSASLYSVYDPMTFPVVSKDRTKVWLVEIDGRQGWYSTGIKGYELYRIAKKLGGWWATRMDGGGSSCMWVLNPATSTGALVNKPCDSKGERSCMTYVLLREK